MHCEYIKYHNETNITVAILPLSDESNSYLLAPFLQKLCYLSMLLICQLICTSDTADQLETK